MRKTLFTILSLAGFMAATALPVSSAHAQLTLDISTADPLTKLPADKWVYLATHLVNANPIVGKDSVYMVNATGEDLTSVTCHGYFLVGPKPYITSNDTTNVPAMLPKWTVSLVPSKSFNDYCKAGVDANGTVANYHGTLNAADHTFSSSTFVVFMKPNGQ